MSVDRVLTVFTIVIMSPGTNVITIALDFAVEIFGLQALDHVLFFILSLYNDLIFFSSINLTTCK